MCGVVCVLYYSGVPPDGVASVAFTNSCLTFLHEYTLKIYRYIQTHILLKFHWETFRAQHMIRPCQAYTLILEVTTIKKKV